MTNVFSNGSMTRKFHILKVHEMLERHTRALGLNPEYDRALRPSIIMKGSRTWLYDMAPRPFI